MAVKRCDKTEKQTKSAKSCKKFFLMGSKWRDFGFYAACPPDEGERQ